MNSGTTTADRTLFTISIHGDPVPKGRPRVSTIGRRAVVYTHVATRRAQNEIAAEARRVIGSPLSGPVCVSISVRIAPPKSWSARRRNSVSGQPHDRRPDLDNLIKLVLDGLNGVAYEDDRQIARISAAKIWAENPGLTIKVTRI